MINKESNFASNHRKTKQKDSAKFSRHTVSKTSASLASLCVLLATMTAASAQQTTNFGIEKVYLYTNPQDVGAQSQLIMNVMLAPSGTATGTTTSSPFFSNGDQIVLNIGGRESFISNTTTSSTNSGSCYSMSNGIYVIGCAVNSTTAIITLGQMSAQYNNFTVGIKTFLNPPAEMTVKNISVRWVANGALKGSHFGSEIYGFMSGTIREFFLTTRDSHYSGQMSRYDIFMTPQHSIPGNSKIEIQFPQSFQLPADYCFIENAKAPMLSSAKCMITTTNSLVLSYPFAQTAPYKPDMYPSLNFAPSFWGKNPYADNTTTSEGFGVYTYLLDTAGNKYLIDKNWFPLTQAFYVQSPPPENQTTSNETAGTNETQPSNTTNETKPYYNQTTPYLYGYFSAVSSYVAGDQYVSYILEIVPSKIIPVGGTIRIEFPPEISSPASKNQTFQAQTEGFCGYYRYSTGEYINTYSYGGYLPMTFKMIYQGDSDIQPGQNLQIFCHGFNNPRTTDPTSSFIIETFDAQSTYIERNEYPVQLYIYQAAQFRDFQIFTSNETAPAGKFDDYTFSISSSVEHYYGEALFIEFPQELQLTTISSCLWDSTSEYKLQCDFIPTNNTLKVTLNFAMNVFPVGAPINFNVTGVNVSAGVQKNYSTFYNARIVDYKDRLITQLYYKVPVRYFGQEAYYYIYPTEYYNQSYNYNETENNTYNKYPEYNNTNGTYPPPPQNGTNTNETYPPPPQNGTTNGTYPPPPQNGTTNGTYPPPQNGSAGGNQTYPPPPPQNGTNQTNPPPYNGTNQNWTYPPYQNGTNYTKPPVNGTNNTYPPPQNGTNQTAPPPQNNTGNTTMPPKNQTNGTQMPIGTIVENRMLYQSDITLGKNTTYYIIYQTMTLTNAGSTFMIQVPRNVRVESLTSVFIIYQNESYQTDFKVENRTIKLYNFYFDVPAGETLQISLESLTNPMTQLNSQSFMLTSFTDSSFTTPIDSIVDSLDIRFECNYPCQSCSTEDMNYCLSCFDRSAVIAAFPNASTTSSSIYNYTFPYLYYGMCYNKCPLGSFMADNRNCKSCPEGCATCQNEKSCSICDKYSKTPFLNNGTCMTECPTGLCPNEGRCGDCSSKKFKTFNITASPKSMGQISTLMFNFSLDSTKNISFLPNDTIVINFPKEHGFDTSIESFTSICNSLTTPFFLTACDVQYNIVKVVLGKQNTTSTTGAIYNTLAKGYLYYSFTLSVQNFQNPLNKRSIENITAFLYDNATNTKAAILNARIDNFTAPQGQYFDNETGSWVDCPDSCTECFQDFTSLQVKCKACQKGWLVDNQTALCRQNCTSGMIYDFEQKSCVNCEVGLWSTWQANKCYQCSQNCFACNMRYSPNTSFGTVSSNTTNATTECTKCQEGYQFDLTRKFCLIPCGNGTIYDPESNSCQPCKENQFANYTSQQCKACPENCDKCDFNATSKRVECSVCSQNPGVFFDPLLKMCKLPCNASQFFDAPTYSCKDCKFGIRNNTKELQQCTICPSNCKTCAFNSTTQKIDCTSCATNQTLDYERKICRPSCNNVSFYNWDTLECQRCQDFEYLHPVQQKCKPCPGNCQSCRYNTTAKKPTVPLVAQNAISRLSRKLQTASGQNNTFFNNTGDATQDPTLNNTSNSSDNTQNMTDNTPPVRQTSEFDTYTPLFQNYFMNASCTSCFPGQVIDVDTLACRRECPVNAFFNWTINDCQPCKTNEYYNKLYKKCTACPTSCTSCVANNTKPDQAVCTSCITDYIVENSICRKSCNQSQYYDSYYKTCGNCKYPCLKCASSYQCLQCDSMYYMKDNKTCTFKCTAGKELWNNQTQSCQAIRSGIKLSIMTTPAKTSFKCREVTVTAQGQGITDNDQPIYVWSYSVQEMSSTTSNAATTPSYTTAFKSGLEQLIQAANEQGSLMITVPSYLTSIVTRNVTVKFTLAMFIGAQNATNSTSILIQPTVYSELTDVESQYFIRAAEGFSLNASLTYPDCAAFSNSASDIIPYNRSLGCGLYNSTTNKLIKSLPGQCLIKPNELEMGTVYTLRTNFIVNYMQPAIVKNITLVTTYEDPQCTIPVNGILNYVKISEKLTLNPIVINKKSTLIYKWSAWPVNSNTKIQINGTNNNYNLSVTAASYLKAGNQYNIRLEITDSKMAETNSVCEVLVEAVNATAKTLRMAISDTANTRNYTDPTQNFTAVCLQTDEEFNNISYTWTVTRKPDNAVLFSSTVKSSLIVANQNSLSIYPSGFKYTSTGTSFEVACVAQNLKYYGKIAKTYTVTQLISTQVAVAVSPTSGRANETLFTVNVTVAKEYQNLNCGLQYYLSNSQFINITDFKEMFTSADGLKDTFKLQLDRVNSTVDSQTIIALCTDDTGAYAKASTKVTVYKPAITNSTIATNTTTQTIRQVALESSGFLNP